MRRAQPSPERRLYRPLGLDRLAASVPGALPRAGLFRPLRGKSWWCSARSLGIPSSRARKGSRGVAPGWYVQAPSGQIMVVFGEESRNSFVSREERFPGRCPGLVCSGPFGANHGGVRRGVSEFLRLARGKVPGALPRAGMFRPLRGKSWWCSARSLGIPSSRARKGSRGVAPGWYVQAPSGQIMVVFGEESRNSRVGDRPDPALAESLPRVLRSEDFPGRAAFESSRRARPKLCPVQLPSPNPVNRSGMDPIRREADSTCPNVRIFTRS